MSYPSHFSKKIDLRRAWPGERYTSAGGAIFEVVEFEPGQVVLECVPPSPSLNSVFGIGATGAWEYDGTKAAAYLYSAEELRVLRIVSKVSR